MMIATSTQVKCRTRQSLSLFIGSLHWLCRFLNPDNKDYSTAMCYLDPAISPMSNARWLATVVNHWDLKNNSFAHLVDIFNLVDNFHLVDFYICWRHTLVHSTLPIAGKGSSKQFVFKIPIALARSLSGWWLWNVLKSVFWVVYICRISMFKLMAYFTHLCINSFS